MVSLWVRVEGESVVFRELRCVEADETHVYSFVAPWGEVLFCETGAFPGVGELCGAVVEAWRGCAEVGVG